MEEGIIKTFNEHVKDEDTVYILGDISFTGNTVTRELYGRMKGHKHLILGNHDRGRSGLTDVFESISIYKELKDEKIVMFHYPILSWNGQARDWIHLHGHSHGNLTKLYDKDGNEMVMKKMDVGIDCTDYKPISLDGVYAHFEGMDTVSADHHYRGSE